MWKELPLDQAPDTLGARTLSTWGFFHQNACVAQVGFMYPNYMSCPAIWLVLATRQPYGRFHMGTHLDHLQWLVGEPLVYAETQNEPATRVALLAGFTEVQKHGRITLLKRVAKWH